MRARDVEHGHKRVEGLTVREQAGSLIPGGPAIEVPELPIYHQIARQIHARIYHELYRPGDAIPSENELGQEFGVSRLTIRQALRQLTYQGVLHTRRGQGT